MLTCRAQRPISPAHFQTRLPDFITPTWQIQRGRKINEDKTEDKWILSFNGSFPCDAPMLFWPDTRKGERHNLNPGFSVTFCAGICRVWSLFKCDGWLTNYLILFHLEMRWASWEEKQRRASDKSMTSKIWGKKDIWTQWIKFMCGCSSWQIHWFVVL